MAGADTVEADIPAVTVGGTASAGIASAAAMHIPAATAIPPREAGTAAAAELPTARTRSVPDRSLPPIMAHSWAITSCRGTPFHRTTVKATNPAGTDTITITTTGFLSSATDSAAAAGGIPG